MSKHRPIAELDSTTPALDGYAASGPAGQRNWDDDIVQALATFGPTSLKRIWGAKIILGDERFVIMQDACEPWRPTYFVLLSPVPDFFGSFSQCAIFSEGSSRSRPGVLSEDHLRLDVRVKGPRCSKCLIGG